MDEFTQKLIISIIDKLVIGIPILVVGYFITKAVEKYKGQQAVVKEYEIMRDKTALEYLQRQIEELYSPLLGLIQQSRVIFEVEQKKLLLKGNPDDYSKTKNYFIEEYYIPLNSQMADLMRKKIHLLETNDIPGSFHQFLRHETQFLALHKLWKDNEIRSDGIGDEKYPPSLENDVKKSLESLRTRYNQFLKRLEISLSE